MKWSLCVLELLGLHEVFRKLGYPAADLFVSPHLNGHVQFWMLSPGQEQKFVIDVMRVDDVQALLTEWQKAVAWWNDPTTSEDERDAIFRGSRAFKDKVGLVHSLSLRGLYPLKGTNVRGQGVQRPN